MRELVLYTDESVKQGRYYSNFYGGALVRSGDIDDVRRILHDAADAAGFGGEVKWQKVTEPYLNRYKMLMDGFFELVAEDRVKVRIMFTQRRWIPTNLTPKHQEQEYHILYYQFLKHAFGLRYCNPERAPLGLRVYLDQLPEGGAKNSRFKQFVRDLQSIREFRESKIQIVSDQIAEVRSHDHIILQCLDIVLGAMQFRLNDMHLEKAPGSNRRGKRTIAKEKLYKHINRKIRSRASTSASRLGDWAGRSAAGRTRIDTGSSSPRKENLIRPSRSRNRSDPTAAMSRRTCLKWNLGLRGQQGRLGCRIAAVKHERKR